MIIESGGRFRLTDLRATGLIPEGVITIGESTGVIGEAEIGKEVLNNDEAPCDEVVVAVDVHVPSDPVTDTEASGY